MPVFEHIIVGAGSAGGVFAARLSEAADPRVLLIKAGGRTDHWSIRMPAAVSSNFEGGPWNWCYDSVPQRHLAGRRIFQPRGKGLGGSSAISGMAYIRGHALDYQRWVEEGAASWSYAEVLPYFRRSERHSRGEDPWRGGSGPLTSAIGATGRSSANIESMIRRRKPGRDERGRSERAGARGERGPPHRAAVGFGQCRAGAWYCPKQNRELEPTLPRGPRWTKAEDTAIERGTFENLEFGILDYAPAAEHACAATTPGDWNASPTSSGTATPWT